MKIIGFSALMERQNGSSIENSCCSKASSFAVKKFYLFTSKINTLTDPLLVTLIFINVLAVLTGVNSPFDAFE